ncbi:RNA-binding protein [Termitidicoccus mucosus]|uniref:RNA-binding protein n=1 Tax=Termitidicoccus mucosus TaxID=1184151 RepID=A0A178IL93_9BACT|nr:RNA-binding protein [Opitutaceae bacterium TSB47]
MTSSKLYIGNLPFSTTAQELQDLFSQAGGVAAVDLIFDKFTGRSRGFAFVEMAGGEDAQKAIERFHGYDLGGRKITVNEARPREERPRGNFGGGGGEDRRGFGGERRGGFGGRRDRDRDRGYRG